MTGPYNWHWPRLIAPFRQVLGPMSDTAPILGGRSAIVGQYRGQQVWLVWHQVQDAGGVDTTLSLAMYVGYPVMGAIGSDGREHEPRPSGVSASLDPIAFRLTPAEVSARIVVDDAMSFHVRRMLRGRVGDCLSFQNGFIRTFAEYHEPTSIPMAVGPRRPPTLEEASGLVEDTAFLATRVREAYERVYAEIAHTRGPEAAEAWTRAAADAQAASARRARTIRMACYGAAGCTTLVVLALTFAFVLSVWRSTGY